MLRNQYRYTLSGGFRWHDNREGVRNFFLCSFAFTGNNMEPIEGDNESLASSLAAALATGFKL